MGYLHNTVLIQKMKIVPKGPPKRVEFPVIFLLANLNIHPKFRCPTRPLEIDPSPDGNNTLPMLTKDFFKKF